MARIEFLTIFLVAVVMIASFQKGASILTVTKIDFSPMNTTTIWIRIFHFPCAASSLKCWSCSSETPIGEFCRDPFDASAVNDQLKRWTFIECAFPPSQSSNHRAVCKKTIQAGEHHIFETIFFFSENLSFRVSFHFKWIYSTVNDKHIVLRACHWESNNATKNGCTNSVTSPYVKTEFCETCDTDGCNSATQYAPVALLVAIPVAIAKISLLFIA